MLTVTVGLQFVPGLIMKFALICSSVSVCTLFALIVQINMHCIFQKKISGLKIV